LCAALAIYQEEVSWASTVAMKTSPIKELFVATSETHNDWRNIAIALIEERPVASSQTVSC
ncbi:MAG: hypothetical protein JWN74_1922, partial [Acidobacteriaceae bacterium]|nr:hypothetical protein [Acidobacteriaceae bacterium]